MPFYNDIFNKNFVTDPVLTTTPAPVLVQPGTPTCMDARKKQGSFTIFRGAVQKVKAATVEWTAEWSDEWVKKYGHRNKAIASTENDSLIERLEEGTGEEFDEVSPFFSSYPSSRVLERQACRVQRFCAGSVPILDNSISDGLDSDMSHSEQGPSAWVSDRNWNPNESEDSAVSNVQYERVLNTKELYAVLEKKRFSEKENDEKAGPPRRIYINRPDGNTITAILKTTPPSQVPGFRELISNYITGDPSPVIRSREIFWWGGNCFLFSFNLPFFVTSSQPHGDNRTLFNGKRPLRRRHDISFLNLGIDEEEYSRENGFSQEDLFLVEGVCSIVVTGKNDRYWTAVCFNDDLTADEDEPRLSTEDEVQHVAGETDPIVIKQENENVSPRAYALAALATALKKVSDYHRDIQIEVGISLRHHTPNPWQTFPDTISLEQMNDWRKKYFDVLNLVIDCNGRIIEKLERFLLRDLLISPEGLPRHPLWQSVPKEERAMQSLIEIRDSLEILGEVDSELKRFLRICLEERREKKSKYQDEQSKFQTEQKDIDKRMQKITLAAFVLAILNLVAQIYAARPENVNVTSSLGFMFLTWGSFATMGNTY
ncbi:hypothetical protein ACHAQD_003955 [Fusarium lateritium]